MEKTSLKAYASTIVSVGRSQEAIRKLVMKAGGRGIQFTDDFTMNFIYLRFSLPVEVECTSLNLMVNLQIPKGETEQQERQMYRALHWYIKVMLEAVEFGIVKTEDAFLAFFEMQLPDRTTTVGEELKPNLAKIAEGTKTLLLPGGN